MGVAHWIQGADAWAIRSQGTPVLFKPKGGTPRTVLAIVDYEAPQVVDGAGNVVTPKVVATVANRRTALTDDGVGGIAFDEYNPGGGDTIPLPEFPGSSTTETLGVYRPPRGAFSVDAGMHTVILR